MIFTSFILGFSEDWWILRTRCIQKVVGTFVNKSVLVAWVSENLVYLMTHYLVNRIDKS